MIHILLGDAAGDTDAVLEAGKSGKPLGWIVPKTAHAGDRALFYLPAPRGFAARGVIGTEPWSTGQGGYGQYRATVGKITLLDPVVPLAFLRENHRSWKWLTYPRGYTTIDGRIEERLEELLKSFKESLPEGVSKSAPDVSRMKKRTWSTKRIEEFAAEAPDNLVAVAKVHNSKHPQQGLMYAIAYKGKLLDDDNFRRVPKRVAVKLMWQLRNIEEDLLERLEMK